jgi:hypothetical protein
MPQTIDENSVIGLPQRWWKPTRQVEAVLKQNPSCEIESLLRVIGELTAKKRHQSLNRLSWCFSHIQKLNRFCVTVMRFSDRGLFDKSNLIQIQQIPSSCQTPFSPNQTVWSHSHYLSRILFEKHFLSSFSRTSFQIPTNSVFCKTCKLILPKIPVIFPLWLFPTIPFTFLSLSFFSTEFALNLCWPPSYNFQFPFQI